MRGKGTLRLETLVILGLTVPCVSLKALGSVACNGDPGYCELRVDQFTWAGTHNADATHLRLRGLPLGCITDNHEHYVNKEMDQGLRFFDVDTCYTGSGELYICHGPAYGLLFKPEMENIKKWLESNPHELIVLSFVNANVQSGGDPEKYKMMQEQSKQTTEVFGDMLMIPEMEGGQLTSSWPKLGDLVKENKRVIVLWGKALYFHIFNHDKENAGFRDQHIWFERYWTMTYGSSYQSMGPSDLATRLEDFCNDPDDKTKFKHGQAMVLVDSYLTISPKRRSFSYCNLDLASDVNPLLLEQEDLDTNPLMVMQENCWKTKKQISLISMDFTQYFPQHLDRLATKLNEANFAHYGFIAGKITLDDKGQSQSDVKALLVKIAGGPSSSRISVDGGSEAATARRLNSSDARRLAGKVSFPFSISADATDPLGQTPNRELMATMKQGAGAEGASVTAVCRDPGQAHEATRVPAAVQASFDEGEKLVFTCKTGWVNHGSLERVCGADGLFTGVQPECLETWTREYRIMPFWCKILLLLLGICLILACIGGCICLCVRKKKGYNQIKEEPQ